MLGGHLLVVTLRRSRCGWRRAERFPLLARDHEHPARRPGSLLLGWSRSTSVGDHDLTHGLRHSHATALIAAGEHVRVVSERLGHYSSAFTLDTYASVLKGMQRDAVERLASVVGPKIGDG